MSGGGCGESLLMPISLPCHKVTSGKASERYCGSWGVIGIHFGLITHPKDEGGEGEVTGEVTEADHFETGELSSEGGGEE